MNFGHVLDRTHTAMGGRLLRKWLEFPLVRIADIVRRQDAVEELLQHGAIKAGNILNIRQMKQLLEDLFHTDKPFVCPHGRPIILRFTPEELAKLFKRT